MSLHSVESQGPVKFFCIRFRNNTDPGYPGFCTLPDEGGNDLLPDTHIPVRRKDDKILDIPIGDSIRDDPSHSYGMPGLLIDSHGKCKTFPDQVRNGGRIIIFLPPSAGMIELYNLIPVPCIHETDDNSVCHCSHTCC